jgi:hypothetical protein
MLLTSKILTVKIARDFVMSTYTGKDWELGSPSALARGGKATRADLSAFKINVFHGVGHLYKPLHC